MFKYWENIHYSFGIKIVELWPHKVQILMIEKSALVVKGGMWSHSGH